MSEQGFITIAGLVIGAITGTNGILAYFANRAAKLNRKAMDLRFDEHNKLDSTVINKVDAQAVKLHQIHIDINGRVAELVAIKVKEALVDERANVASIIAESVPAAVAIALEKERARVADKLEIATLESLEKGRGVDDAKDKTDKVSKITKITK